MVLFSTCSGGGDAASFSILPLEDSYFEAEEAMNEEERSVLVNADGVKVIAWLQEDLDDVVELEVTVVASQLMDDVELAWFATRAGTDCKFEGIPVLKGFLMVVLTVESDDVPCFFTD